MKNQLLSFALGICSLLLTACSGSDQTPANTQTVVSVSNQTASDFSQVSIEEHLSGKVFEAKSFSCPARQIDCKLYYTGAEITGPAVAIFKDTKGHIVGIYDVDHAPGSYMAPEVSLWSTGAYLYEALVNLKLPFGSMAEAERQAALSVFVSDKRAADRANETDISAESANQLTHYEALALNFLNQQINGPITVSAYVQNLAKRLSQREVAPRAEFSSTNHLTPVSISSIFHLFSNRLKSLRETDLIRSALAQTSPSCDKSSKLALAFFSGVAASIPKEFPIAGLVAKSTTSLASAACNDTGTKLNEILDKLNAVQNSLNNLSDDVGKLTDFVAGLETDSILQDFADVIVSLTALFKDFQVILLSKGAASLKDYVQIVGGTNQDALTNILREQPDGTLATLLQNLSATLNQSYLLQLQSLTENKFDSLLSALDLQCTNPTTGDLILLRVKCNLVITTSSSRLLAAQAIAFRLASDTYDLLEAYPQQATRYGYDLSKTATQHKSELRVKFNKQADLMISKFQQTVKNSNGKTGRYEALDGLAPAMLSNIIAANCSGSPENPYARVPSISAWVRKSGDEYLLTNCKNNTVPVLSRYYIKTSNVDASDREVVTNVLGVLIPSANADTSKVRPYSEVENVRKIAMKYTDYWPTPGAFAFYGPIPAKTLNVVSDGIAGSGESFRVIEQAWNSSLMKAAGLTLYDQPRRPFPTPGVLTDHWMRFTDVKGYSYVFVFRAAGTGAVLLCVTAECSADNNDSGSGLSFKEGPQKFGLTLGQTLFEIASDGMRGQDEFGPYGREINGWTLNRNFIDAQ